MEYKSCEQYVLAELERAQNEIVELNDFIKCQHQEILELRRKVEEYEASMPKELDRLDIE